MKHAICYLFKNVKLIFASMKQQNKGQFLSFKTLFRHRHCFLSSVVTHGKDGHGLKLEKVGPTF